MSYVPDWVLFGAADAETATEEGAAEALEGTGCRAERIALAVDRLPVLRLVGPDAAARRRGRKALREAGYRYSDWRPARGYQTIRGWH